MSNITHVGQNRPGKDSNLAHLKALKSVMERIEMQLFVFLYVLTAFPTYKDHPHCHPVFAILFPLCTKEIFFFFPKVSPCQQQTNIQTKNKTNITNTGQSGQGATGTFSVIFHSYRAEN